MLCRKLCQITVALSDWHLFTHMLTFAEHLYCIGWFKWKLFLLFRKLCWDTVQCEAKEIFWSLLNNFVALVSLRVNYFYFAAWSDRNPLMLVEQLVSLVCLSIELLLLCTKLSYVSMQLCWNVCCISWLIHKIVLLCQKLC